MNKTNISNIQLRALIVTIIVGIGAMSLPNALASEMGNDGWIAIVLSSILMIPIIVVLIQIFKQNPGKDFFQIGKETLGFTIFTLCKIIYLAYLIVFLSFVVRNLAELIKAFLLPTTPLEMIILAFIIATSYIASYEIDVIARAAYFIYPLTIVLTVLIVIIALPDSDFTNVLPLFQTKLSTIPKGIWSAFFSFTGFEMIIFALPFVQKKEKSLKASMIGLGIVTVIYLVFFFMCTIQFSIEQIARQTFPVLQLTKQLDLPGYFLENLDGLVMAIWTVVVFATMAPAYFGANKVLAKIFNTKKHKYFSWGLIPVIYYVALIPENFVEIQNQMVNLYNILAIITIIIIPALILVVGYIRKKVKA